MKKLILLLPLIIIMGCTAEEMAIMRKVDKEYKERGRECLYDGKGNIISCDYIIK